MSRKVMNYAHWENVRLQGRGGKKKVRRDLTLAKRDDGLLTFTYGNDELMATLDKFNTYTFYKGDCAYYPTHSNIYNLVGGITVYRDSSHYKHYQQPIRIVSAGGRYAKNDKGGWSKTKNTMPMTNGIQYRNGKCLNPEIAQDFKRVLNRTLSSPWLRKTEVLAKVLRVAVRMGIMERKKGRFHDVRFEDVNIEDPTAEDAEIVLHKGNAMGVWGWRAQQPGEYEAAVKRAAENGLADYREWLYLKHGCYEMLPVEHQTEGEVK